MCKLHWIFSRVIKSGGGVEVCAESERMREKAPFGGWFVQSVQCVHVDLFGFFFVSSQRFIAEFVYLHGGN